MANPLHTIIVGTPQQVPSTGTINAALTTVLFRFPVETSNFVIPDIIRIQSNIQTLSYDGTVIFSNGFLIWKSYKFNQLEMMLFFE